jgi:hypothetical protein
VEDRSGGETFCSGGLLLKSPKLRTGLIITNTETNNTGVVIDWGIKDKRLSRYLPLPAYNKMGEWVRVWTSSGQAIEVWSLRTIRVNGS